MIKNKEIAETAIREGRKTVNYNTVKYSLEYFIDKISQQQINDNLNWDEAKQSYFIESLILDIPVFKIVFIDKDNNDGYSVIDDVEQLIDGKQRLLTALNFINSNLRLSNLKSIKSLNGFTFEDLMLPRQRKFKRISVRAIAVNPKSDLSVFTRY